MVMAKRLAMMRRNSVESNDVVMVVGTVTFIFRPVVDVVLPVVAKCFHIGITPDFGHNAGGGNAQANLITVGD